MKRHLKLYTYLVLAMAITFASCGGEDDPSAEEQKAEELSGTWNLTTATPTGNDAVTLAGVSVTFSTALDYSIAGVDVLTSSNLNNGDDFAGAGTFTITGTNQEILTLTPGGAFTTTVSKETGAISLQYSAPYPKATDAEISITITGTLAN